MCLDWAPALRDDPVAWSRGYGLGNIAEGVPFTTDQSLFRIASITKTMSATAVLQLHYRRYFRPDDDVNGSIGIPNADVDLNEIGSLVERTAETMA